MSIRKAALITLTAGSIVLTSACATSDSMSMEKQSMASSEAIAAIAAAEMSNKAAAEVGYEWRDTGKIIKEAKKLADKGNNDEAIKMAHKAEKQGKDAVMQYKTESMRFSKM